MHWQDVPMNDTTLCIPPRPQSRENGVMPGDCDDMDRMPFGLRRSREVIWSRLRDAVAEINTFEVPGGGRMLI
jgi:hypothetical protein